MKTRDICFALVLGFWMLAIFKLDVEMQHQQQAQSVIHEPVEIVFALNLSASTYYRISFDS